MLRSCSSRLRQGTGRAQSWAAGPSGVLCGAVHVQRRGDGAVSSQPTGAALPAGNSLQQRSQHNRNGPYGQVAVRRGPRGPLAAGRGLHPCGPCAGHGGGGAAVGAAAAPGRAAAAAGARRAATAAAPAAAATATATATWSRSGGTAATATATWSRSGGAEVPAFAGCIGEAATGGAVGCWSGGTRSPAWQGRVGGRGRWDPKVVVLAEVAAAGTAPAAAAAAEAPSGAAAASAGRPVASSSGASDTDPGLAAAPSTSTSSAASPSNASPGWDRSGGLGRLGRLSYRLILAYDGTEYCGWQLQPSAPTVQRCLEAALCTVLREERPVLGVRAAGRTDSGVHARGQVVQFSCDRDLDVTKMPYKLNAVLPHDIRVMRMARTAPDLSVMCSTLGKCYHYNLANTEAHDPLRYRYAHHVRKPLDLAAMRAAAAALVGTHDFTQFSNIGEEGGRPRKRNPIKTLRRVDVVELGEAVPGGLRLEVEGNGFLYKMVRHISGVLVAVGEGRLPAEAVARMLEVGNNAPPGCGGTYRGYNVAPAKGLCLHDVFYDPRVDDPSVLLYPDLLHDEYGRLLESIPDSRSDEE